VGRPSKYSPEFRRDAVALVVQSRPDRTLADVGRELGVNAETLRQWVAAAEKGRALRAAGLGEDELAELKRLRRENAELKLEKEILRKAAQYFAREMGR
jgi:transposase